MQAAPRDLVRSIGARSRERVAVGLLAAAFLAIVVIAAGAAVREIERLDDRRAVVAADQFDPAQAAGDAAEAFRRFRSQLDRRAHFALVFGPGADRNTRGFYRLFAGYYLYPAIAVDDPARADAVMAVGAPAASELEGFEQIEVVGDVWLGRRRPA